MSKYIYDENTSEVVKNSRANPVLFSSTWTEHELFNDDAVEAKVISLSASTNRSLKSSNPSSPPPNPPM